MAQTKFVLSKALKAGLKPLVVLNKMDRKERIRPDEVEGDVFDLFVNLEAKDHQLDYPTLYASGREGWAVAKKGESATDMAVLLDAIIQYGDHHNIYLISSSTTCNQTCSYLFYVGCFFRIRYIFWKVLHF